MHWKKKDESKSYVYQETKSPVNIKHFVKRQEFNYFCFSNLFFIFLGKNKKDWIYAENN